MRVASATGEHGDIHHTVTFRGHSLRLVSGPHYSAKRQEEFWGEWTVRNWESPHGERKEYRREAGGLRSRYMTLAPNGWVEYSDAPAEVAGAFDRLLDSICWRPLKP